jgi:Zn-dependent peptidase ImmA (M78 family)
MPRRTKRIQTLVEDLLDQYAISAPPVDVNKIAEEMGIKIKEGDLGEISGLVFTKGTQVIIGVNEKDSPKRKRFTIAHELGHHYLHSQNPLYVDKVFAVRLRDHISSEAVSSEEIEANAFAAELLMPSRMILQDIGAEANIIDYENGGIDSITDSLAARYKVSNQAMTIRLMNLGFIRDEG